MERYASYKDSGVDWLGEIPAHWEVKRNKFLFAERCDVVGKKAANFLLLSLTLKGVIPRDMENPKGKFPAEFDTYKIVAPDDIIFCLFDIEETPRTVGKAIHHGMITGAYTVVRCFPGVSSAYLNYYYLSLDQEKRLQPLYTGLRKVIQRNTFFGMSAPYPPPVEQDRIVAFLDQKTAEIDAAIAKKERLIELLQEQKSILINQAVTRGLNPDVPLRDSGVEWIGQIPAHWEVRKVAHTFRSIGSGTTPPSGDFRYYENGTIDWINTGDLTDWDIIAETKKLTPLALRRHSTLKIYPKGTLIIAMYGATIGKTGVSTAPATVNQACCCLNGSDAITSRYMQLWFFGYKREIVSMGYGGGQPNISQEVIRSLRIPVPPADEQTVIVSHVERSITKIDRVIETTRVTMSQLNEIKISLIASAVTGKIKV